MGRPLNKRLFGADAKNNLKVQFFNGTVSVPGYIVRQLGSKKFLCSDADGNTAVCFLVDKASANLATGEMSITVKLDNGTTEQVTKISSHLVTANDRQETWEFTVSNSDNLAQIEEAGTNTAMTSATNLEGDDFVGDKDYPLPGSGEYVDSADITAIYSPWNTPANISITGSLTTIPNSVSGLYRTKWKGMMLGAPNSVPSDWDMTFPNSNYQFVKGTVDTYGGFGSQIDVAPNTQFSLEWKGYIKVPTSQAWNFVFNVDDNVAMWIGPAAKNPTNANYHAWLSGGSQTTDGHATNGVVLNNAKWYPIRIWFSENTGTCNMQVFAIGADQTKLNGADLQFAHNGTTLGY
jgi:hypothetical protein